MRKRIQQLANGKFDCTGPNLSLSTTRIELEVLEGKDETGDFIITSKNHVKMRGIIYSSNPRMECLTPQFEGEEVRIRYQFHSEGLIEGDIQKGDFVIVCNQGEYNLSFVASVSKLYADSSIGKIRKLTDFTKLSRESFSEAYRLFYSPNFKNLIKKNDANVLRLYEGLKGEIASEQKVEEFLVAAGKKKPIQLELVKEQAAFYDTTTSRKEQLELQKNQWGYIEVHVSSDADFLVPAKTIIKTEDFLGSVCFVEYIIKAEYLHAGKNFGRLKFDYPGGHLFYEVMVSTKSDEKQVSEHIDVQKGKAQLMQLYMDYRLKKIVTGVWTKRSVEILDHLLAMNPKEDMYQLMKAQALIINKQRQDASWILEDFKRECIDRTTPLWGYYLYLCTLMEREESYVDRLTAEIEEIFHKHPNSSLLFWILLFVKDEYYRNSARRLKALERWIANRNDSPYLYLEAYYLLWQDPYLLVHLGKFEVKILNWARKQDALSKDLILQIMNLIPEQREFEPHIFKLLEACYRQEPSDELLADICAYLIKGQRLSNQYHEWYELGIEHEVRITNLYEAYLISMDAEQISAVPKMIQMYFQYHNNLSYRQLAVLFVNIIAGKEKQPEVYQKYRRTIEQFAMEQIEAGHINDHLAVVYEEMLSYGILNQELASKLSKILFTHKLYCVNKDIVKVLVVQSQVKKVQEIAVVNHVAYFQAYSEQYTLILQDSAGNYLCEPKYYVDEALMQPQKYMEQCIKLAFTCLPYQIFYFENKEQYPAISDYEEEVFSYLLQSKEVTYKYKADVVTEAINYYKKCHFEGGIEKQLKDVEFGKLSVESRRYLAELYVEMHMFDKAYQVAQLYGYDYLSNAAKVSLCSYEITRIAFEEDDYLLGFAQSAFLSGKYNDVILIYLCKFYNGPTKLMSEIWKAAGQFEIDTYDLEERIITQMLYSTDYVENIDKIYESYCAGGGRELVCMAYISYFAHFYLTQDMIVPEIIFSQIRERMMEEKELNDACKLGLLKYYSELEEMTEKQIQAADQLLLEYTCRNMYFSFYKRLDKSLVLKYHMYDKFFLEHHVKKDCVVRLHYSMNGQEFVTEEMTEIYDGIFVKEFILFFGETIQYYISEEDESGNQETCVSNQIAYNNIYGDSNQSRYAMMNETLFQMTLNEKTEVKRKLKNYHGMKTVTEKIFHLM